MGCSVDCAKCLVIVFSIVYAIVGAASILIGTYYFTQELNVLKNLDDQTKTDVKNIDDAATAHTWGALLFIITGVLEFLFAVAGIYSAWKENNCLVRTYATLLAIMFAVHIVLTGLSFSQNSNDNSFNTTKEKVRANFHEYLDSTKARNIQHYFEEQYHCCGLDTYKDYDIILEMSPVPQTCCADKITHCESSNPRYQPVGCLSAVTSKINFHYKTVGAVSVIVAILEFFGSILTFYFSNTIRNEKRRGTYT